MSSFRTSVPDARDALVEITAARLSALFTFVNAIHIALQNDRIVIERLWRKWPDSYEEPCGEPVLRRRRSQENGHRPGPMMGG